MVNLWFTGYWLDQMPTRTMRKAGYSIELVTRSLVIISDSQVIEGLTILDDPESVVSRVHALEASLSVRRLFYRDLAGQFHELSRVGGLFKGLSRCSDSRRVQLNRLIA